MAKNTLFDDDDSGSENGFAETARGQELKINEDYARRFEHNKKRAEIHRRMPPSLRTAPLTPPPSPPQNSINNKC